MTYSRLPSRRHRWPSLRLILKLAGGYAALTGLLITLGAILEWQALGVLGLLLVGFGAILGPIALMALLLSLIPHRPFKQAVVAVQAGDLSVSWLFYGRGINLVVVDEPSRQIFINGGIHPFDMVKEIEWTTSGKPAHIRIVLRAGNAPVLTVPLGSSDDAARVAHRLQNTLDRATGPEDQPVMGAPSRGTPAPVS